MKKFLIIIGVIAVMIFNYGLFSFDKGLVKINNSEDDLLKQVAILISIEKISYYDTPSFIEGEYVLIIKSREGNYLFKSSRQEIEILSAGGMFIQNVKPVKRTVIPVPVYLIAIVIIAAIPFKKKEPLVEGHEKIY